MDDFQDSGLNNLVNGDVFHILENTEGRKNFIISFTDLFTHSTSIFSSCREGNIEQIHSLDVKKRHNFETC